jgi:hypothetical protein
MTPADAARRATARVEAKHALAIIAAARRYVYAERARAGNTGPATLELVLEVDAAYHELAVLVAGTCTQCDEGTCPALELAETVVDRRGRL